jgi:hypothetical protein
MIRGPRSAALAGALAAACTVALAVPAAATPAAKDDSDAASLTVLVSDPPGDTRANVKVSGPGGYESTVRRTTVLRDLAPGEYRVSAPVIPNPIGEVTAEPSETTVSLGRGENKATQVTYVLQAPPLSPRGSPYNYAIQSGPTNDPIRWNPCRTITWGPTLPLPAEEEARLTNAFAKAAIASGISFRRAAPGETPAVSVNLTFAPGDRVTGEGSMVFQSTSVGGRTVASSGSLSGTIGTETDGELREALYLHEIGHVLGITHVADPEQVMHEVVDDADAAGYSAGDTAGLQRVGIRGGCLEPPMGAKEVRGQLDGDQLRLSWFQPASTEPNRLTVLQVNKPSATGGALEQATLPKDFDVSATGARQATVRAPASLCDPGATMFVITANGNGLTTTPVTITGCPR